MVVPLRHRGFRQCLARSGISANIYVSGLIWKMVTFVWLRRLGARIARYPETSSPFLCLCERNRPQAPSVGPRPLVFLGFFAPLML